MVQPCNCNGYKLHPVYTAASYHNTHADTSAARPSELAPGYRQTLVLTTKREKKNLFRRRKHKKKVQCKVPVRGTIRAMHKRSYSSCRLNDFY